MSRLMRLRRVLGADRNPLRRPVDRLEIVIMLALVIAFLSCAPLLAAAAGQWTRAAGQDEQRGQRGWQQISAVVLRSGQPTGDLYPLQWDAVRVPARWSAPDGGQRTGKILTTGSLGAGDMVRVWVNQSGQLTGPPLSGSQLSMRVTSAIALAPAILATVLLGAGWLARSMLDRRRLAAWESDWAQVAPHWTGQR
ncbi:MAG TPA: hypothetical protein VH637_17080 [Streptosporangiaceae bacterium]|jgi:hypothetical protein